MLLQLRHNFVCIFIPFYYVIKDRTSIFDYREMYTAVHFLQYFFVLQFFLFLSCVRFNFHLVYFVIYFYGLLFLCNVSYHVSVSKLITE